MTSPVYRRRHPTTRLLTPLAALCFFVFHKGFLAVLLAAVSLSPVSAAPRETFSIPFRDFHGLILVDVKVNGKPAILVLDTGAIQTQVDRKAMGQSADLSVLYVDLQISECRLRDFRILATDLTRILRDIPHVDGILGEDWLRSFHSVHIDYRRHAIEVTTASNVN